MNGFGDYLRASIAVLAEMEKAAHEVGGPAHHFRFVQLPINLGMTEALTRANQTVDQAVVTMVDAAEALGISLETTFTSKNNRPMKIANSGRVIKELFA